MRRNEITDILKSGVAQITFNKVSGDNRVMRATLMEQYLPKKTHNIVVKPKPDHLMAVYDIDNNGWRSIRVDSIIDITV